MRCKRRMKWTAWCRAGCYERGGVMKRVILLVFSDTHGNHKLGLLNPKTVLYDETEEGELIPYTPRLTASQQYLWKL